MEKQQAWQIFKQLGEAFRGTLAEHQSIQQALETLKPVESAISVAEVKA